MDRSIYRKTERGLAEIRTRSGGLDARMRTVLILINGTNSVRDLSSQLSFDPLPLLAALTERGMIELAGSAREAGAVAAVPAPPAPPPARAAAPAAAPRQPEPVAPAPAPVRSTSAATEDTVASKLRPAKIRAMNLLGGLFGPGAEDVARPLLLAKTPDEFHAALAELQDKLAIYQGKKRAIKLIEQILDGS